MTPQPMFLDAAGQPHPTQAEAQFINDRLVSEKIRQQLGILGNDFNERLQRREKYISLKDCTFRLERIYSDAEADVAKAQASIEKRMKEKQDQAEGEGTPT